MGAAWTPPVSLSRPRAVLFAASAGEGKLFQMAYCAMSWRGEPDETGEDAPRG